MSEDPQQDSPVPPKKTPKYPKAPKKPPLPPESGGWRSTLIVAAVFTMIMTAFYFHSAVAGYSKELTFEEFQTLLEQKSIRTVELYKEPAPTVHYLAGEFTPKDSPLQLLSPFSTTAPSSSSASGGAMKYRVPVDLSFRPNLSEYLAKNGFPSVSTKYVDNTYRDVLINLIFVLPFVIIIYLLFRQQIKSAGRNAFSFGKSKARMLSKDKNKVTFADVAGIEEAKEEVGEIVEFLRDPKKFQRLGGRIPKGILMVGPPGTGKTLLAKAIAGEADVPFYGISGSDFVEMFVGVGASRVRDMFEQGQKNAPCLIFIDEIDAVGRSRGHGLGGGHDEREQTLNALLVEMDGIESSEGVIIIAATNRKDVLDPALLRPGRFDREVNVSLPDVKGREQILLVHARKVKAHEDVQWSIIARGTPGFSGAELANVINEAALIAARRNADCIAMPDLEEARDKVRWGRERRSLAMSEHEKSITAYHEAGHAILNVLLEHTDPLHKVTIIPRGPALGVTMSLPKGDSYGFEKKRAVDLLCMIMGGRVAEEVFLNDISSGASGDISQATSIAKKMVCRWGMSEKLGMVQYGDDDDYVFLGRDISRSRGYSGATAQKIDAEILDLINQAYQRATELIQQNRDKVEAIAQALLEYETLEGRHVEDIIKNGHLTDPPPRNIPPPLSPEPKEDLGEGKGEPKDKKGDGPMPGLEGAPVGA